MRPDGQFRLHSIGVGLKPSPAFGKIAGQIRKLLRQIAALGGDGGFLIGPQEIEIRERDTEQNVVLHGGDRLLPAPTNCWAASG